MECDYCSTEVSKTSGKMLVMNSGKRLYFCSSKCEKNWSKGRNLGYANREK